jgi:hypothetical protein
VRCKKLKNQQVVPFKKAKNSDALQVGRHYAFVVFEFGVSLESDERNILHRLRLQGLRIAGVRLINGEPAGTII